MLNDAQRIERLTRVLRAAAEGKLGSTPFAAGADDALGAAEGALCGLLETLRSSASESSNAMTQMLQESNAELQHTVKRLNEAQNQLLQSEKMAAIGQLAAGVAHEINNPIGFVNSNVGSLECYLKSLFAVPDAYEQAQARCAAQGVDCSGVEALKQQIDFDFVKEDIFTLMRETRDGVARVTKIVQDLKDFARGRGGVAPGGRAQGLGQHAERGVERAEVQGGGGEGVRRAAGNRMPARAAQTRCS